MLQAMCWSPGEDGQARHEPGEVTRVLPGSHEGQHVADPAHALAEGALELLEGHRGARGLEFLDAVLVDAEAADPDVQVAGVIRNSLLRNIGADAMISGPENRDPQPLEHDFWEGGFCSLERGGCMNPRGCSPPNPPARESCF